LDGICGINFEYVAGCQTKSQKFIGTGHVLCLAPTPTGCYAGRNDGAIMRIGGWDVVASEYEVRVQINRDFIPEVLKFATIFSLVS